MHKKKIIFLFALLLLVVGIVFMALPNSQPRVVGNLSGGDLSKIKRVIHREIWRGTVPNYSWQSFAQLPAAVREHMADRVQQLEAFPGGIVHATITTGKHWPPSRLQAAYYDLTLRKGPNGWEIVQPIGDIGPSAEFRGF